MTLIRHQKRTPGRGLTSLSFVSQGNAPSRSRIGVCGLFVMITLTTMFILPVDIHAEGTMPGLRITLPDNAATGIPGVFNLNFVNSALDEENETSDEEKPSSPPPRRAAKTQIGIKFGLNNSRHEGKNIDTLAADFEDLRGFGVGIFSAFLLNRFALIQSEILYQQKGALYRRGDQEIVERLTYLELPVLFKLLLTDRMIKPHIFFGPYFALLLSATLKGDFTDEDISRDTNQGDAGYILGLGIDLALDRTIMSVDLRYSRGFIDIYDDIARNESVMVTLGYYFR